MLKYLFICLSLFFNIATQSYAGNWSQYYEKLKDASPWQLVIDASSEFAQPGSAIDLGSGVGQDSLFLLQNGWKVLSLDAEQEAIDLIMAKSKESDLFSKLSVMTSRYENIPFEFLKPVDFVYGAFSVPFCPPTQFDDFWANVINIVKPGGTIAVNLFGNLHSWSANENMTFHSKSQVEVLFKGFEIIKFEEKDEVKDAALQKDVRWHLFNVIAKKKKATT